MSYFRPNIDAMDGYTPGFQPKGPGYVKLNTNENPYPPSPRVLEAIEQAAQSLRKYPNPTADAARQSIAQAFGTSADRVLCGNGSDDILNIAMRSFCDRGDAVAFPYPTYSLYPVLARIQGAIPVEPDFPDDYGLPEALLDAGAKLVFLANPNAPTGTFIDPERIRDFARRLDGVLLVDEAYVDFAPDNCLRLVDDCPNVIVSRTLSKSYSLAGLRFGFAVAQEPLIEGMMKVKDSYNVDALTCAGAAAAIADADWLQRNVARILATRERMAAGLAALGFACLPSSANFVLARVPDGFRAPDVFDALFERRILVRYFAHRRVDDSLRISVGTEEEVDALLAALREIVAAGPTSTGSTQP